jgi:hypothetical protein
MMDDPTKLVSLVAVLTALAAAIPAIVWAWKRRGSGGEPSNPQRRALTVIFAWKYVNNERIIDDTKRLAERAADRRAKYEEENTARIERSMQKRKKRRDSDAV